MAKPAPRIERVGGALILLFARVTLPLYVDLRVEGAERLPSTGATVVASRHYHFLFDALVLLRNTHPPARFWAAVDWTSARWERLGMELLCRLGGWPITLRVDEYSRDRFAAGATAYSLSEAQPMLRAAVRRAIQILRAGETLLIFPEAYTNVDVFPTPKAHGPDFLPFRPGFVKLAQLAERDGKTHVSIVPVGLAYERLAKRRRPPWLPSWRPMWRITMRFGEARSIPPHATPAEIAALRAQVEREVQELSRNASAPQEESRGALASSSEGHGAS